MGSSVILFCITTFYNDFINKPFLDIDLVPNEDYQTAKIIVKNIGMKPANKLVLTINTTGKIIGHPEIFNIQNLTTHNSTHLNLFQLTIPRLVQGSGSAITININSSGDGISEPSSKKYSVYASYDEGSILETKNKVPTLQEQFFGPSFGTLTSLAYLDAILGVSVIIFVIPYAHKISSNSLLRKQARYRYEIFKDILSTRNSLGNTYSTKDNISIAIPSNWSSVTIG